MIHFHVSSSLNRASIQQYGLDWTLMGAAPWIAGSRAPEVEGCYLTEDEFTAAFFFRMNNTGGAVDLWAVEGVDPSSLMESPNGFRYLPERISSDRLTLVRTDVAPVPRHRRP